MLQLLSDGTFKSTQYKAEINTVKLKPSLLLKVLPCIRPLTFTTEECSILLPTNIGSFLLWLASAASTLSSLANIHNVLCY